MIGQLKALRAGQRLTLRVNVGSGIDLTTVTSATLLVRDRALQTAQVEWAATIASGTTASQLVLTRITDGTEQGDYVWCARLFVSGVLLVETLEDRRNLIVFTQLVGSVTIAAGQRAVARASGVAASAAAAATGQGRAVARASGVASSSVSAVYGLAWLLPPSVDAEVSAAAAGSAVVDARAVQLQAVVAASTCGGAVEASALELVAIVSAGVAGRAEVSAEAA